MTPRRPLGKTGVSVSLLGFGVSGPHASPLVGPRQTARLIRSAIEQGVILLDSAPFYGAGEAELRLGRALRGVPRDRIMVLTKVGTLRKAGRWAKDFSPAGVARQLAGSLRALGLDHVDGLLLHGPAPAAMTDDLLSALARIKAAGQARLLGVCGRAAELDHAVTSGAFDLVMAPVRLGQDGPARARIAAARAAGLGVLGIETLSPSAAPVRPLRSAADAWYLARALARRAEALAPADRPAPRACLEWALGPGGADAALITTTRQAHLDQLVAWAGALDGAPPAP